MDGGVIRRIRECGDMIGHVHHETQVGANSTMSGEINYPPIMKALLEIIQGIRPGIPTRDPELA